MAKTYALFVPFANVFVYSGSFFQFNFLMGLLEGLVLFSSISFLIYGIAYFTSPKMKSEFIRFGLEKFGTLTAVLEILGGLGLLAGLVFSPFMLISSGGLALLMLLGVLARIRVKDRFLDVIPALFFFALNSLIFFESMKIIGG